MWSGIRPALLEEWLLTRRCPDVVCDGRSTVVNGKWDHESDDLLSPPDQRISVQYLEPERTEILR